MSNAPNWKAWRRKRAVELLNQGWNESEIAKIFGVTQSADGSVQGHFNCLMAGATQFPGFTLMAVRGQVTSGTISPGSASFDGVGTLLAPGVFDKSAATFHVEVTAGGPGVGTLHLTLLTPFVFDLPIEQVMDGQINIH